MRILARNGITNLGVALASVLATIVGCTSKSDTPADATCEPQESIACIAKDGCHGYALCNADGTGYGACDCSLGKDPNGTGGSSTATSVGSTGGTGGPSSATGELGGSSGTLGGTNGLGGAGATSNGTGGLSASGGTSNAFGSVSTGGTSSGTGPVGGTSNASGGVSTSGGTDGLGGAAGSGGTSSETGPVGGTGGTSSATYRRNKTCDINGQNCKCLNFASLGQPANLSYGSGSSTISEFESWLFAKTNADITFFPTKPATITAEWLSNYDVILLQNLSRWAAFSLKEIAALQAWIVGGGGVIALSGYFADNTSELTNANALLSGSGMAFLSTEAPGQACSEPAIISGNLICPNSRASTTDAKCHCWGNSLPLTDWVVTHPIANHLDAVGAFRGRAVNPGSAGTTVIRFGDTPVGASATVGAGRVFLFGDDLVTYYGQWLTAGFPATDPYNPCWNEVAARSCTSGDVFQYKQFWYNTLRYVAPKTECDFVVNEPEVVLW